MSKKNAKTRKTQKADKDAAKQAETTAQGKADQAPAPDPETKTTNGTDELVVFAFRLLRSERDLIHQVAGSAKASRFVKGVTLAAARGDLDTVKAIVEKGVEGATDA
ncbi:MAG: hypothetical protein GF355_13050 [Candidatus Eisenbacteria bacterium]|nr:hypothetical protein [Candidatus Eisenbacteria bacterium]